MCLDIFAEVGAVSSEQAGIKYVVGLVKFKLQLPGRGGGRRGSEDTNPVQILAGAGTHSTGHTTTT